MQKLKPALLAATLVVALAATNAHASLWVGSITGDVTELDENTGGVLSSFVGISEPVGVEVDSNTGQIYIGKGNTSVVSRYNLDGTGEFILNSITAGAERHSTALDVLGGRIFYSGNGNGVFVANLDGTGSATSLYDPGRSQSIFYNSANDMIYFNDMNSGIWSGNADGSGPATLLYAGSGFRQLTVDITTDQIYWTDFNNGNILEGDIFGINSVATLFSGLSNPWGIDVESSTGTLYWTEISGGVYSGSVSGTGQTLLTTLSHPRGIDIVVSEDIVVPEPTAMLLFGAGIFGLAGARVKRNKQRAGRNSLSSAA